MCYLMVTKLLCLLKFKDAFILDIEKIKTPDEKPKFLSGVLI